MSPSRPPSDAPRLTTTGLPTDPRDAAAYWFARQRSGSFTAAEARSLEAWRALAPSHEEEWQALAFLWQESARLPRAELLAMLGEAQAAEPRSGSSSERSSERSSEPGSEPRSEPGDEPLPGPDHTGNRRAIRAAAGQIDRKPDRKPVHRPVWHWAFAGLALVVAAIALHVARPSYVASFSTARGEVRTEILPDGSQLTLNTASRAEVRYYPGRRTVELVAGEALFDVVPSHWQVFMVSAGEALVRVTGTTFSVRHQTDRVGIAVQAGAVDLRRGPWWRLWGEPHARLSANQGASLANGRLSPITTLDVDRLTSWREGKLVFSNQPLALVVDEMNRYLVQPIRVDDSGLREKRVSGVFNLGSADDFRSAVQASLAVTFRPRPDGGLDLVPR